jgi:hypothetical protein
MKTFEDLEAWKEAKSLAVAVYRITRDKPLSSDFSLRDQIQRSAVSIMSNIAEGFERLHKLEKKQFYRANPCALGQIDNDDKNLLRKYTALVTFYHSL